jgi:cytochrome c-type biogenesis protein CcmH/NrfG
MNYDPNNSKLWLEQYLEGDLSPDEANRVKSLLEADPALREELEALQLAIEAARHKGLHTRVKAIRNSMLAQSPADRKPARLFSIVRSTMRVAAGLLILAGAFAIYKYASVNNTSVYNDLYLQYEPGRTRSVQPDPLEAAFLQKKWSEVIVLSDRYPDNNKNLFLSGVAYLETSKPANAITRFERILKLNAGSGSDYFNDEAEYYLALAYIRNDKPSTAVNLLTRISNTPDHLYRPTAANASMMDLKILTWKDK